MKSTYSPGKFGALIGKRTKTLQRWDRLGILKAHRTITDRRYYTHDQYMLVTGQKAKRRQRISYCRVSSASQKKDLLSQKNALESFCLLAGKIVDNKLEDIGSGLNYKRNTP